MRVLMTVVLVAILATPTWAQYDGYAGAEDNPNSQAGPADVAGTVDSESTTAMSSHPAEVGGRKILYDHLIDRPQADGYQDPLGPTTAQQDRTFAIYAAKRGWITKSYARTLISRSLDASKAYTRDHTDQKVRASKTYTDQKVGAVNDRVDQLGKRVSTLKTIIGDPASGLVKQTNDFNTKINDPKNGLLALVDKSITATNKFADLVSQKLGAIGSRASGALTLSWFAIILSIIAIAISLGKGRFGGLKRRLMTVPPLFRWPRRRPPPPTASHGLGTAAIGGASTPP